MRYPHRPDVNNYIQHYTNQLGGISPFVGEYRQLGYGLGGLFSGLARMLIRPIMKSSARHLVTSTARHALKHGAKKILSKSAQKVLSSGVKTAVKRTAKKALKRGAEAALQTGVDVLSDVFTKRRKLGDSVKARGHEQLQKYFVDQKPIVKYKTPKYKSKNKQKHHKKRLRRDILD
jgi:hypothetical protein